MKRGACSAFVVLALLFCRSDAKLSLETYAQIESMMDRGETIAGAQLVGLGYWEDGSFSVDLLDATPRQLEEAGSLWPGVKFYSSEGFKNMPLGLLP